MHNSAHNFEEFSQGPQAHLQTHVSLARMLSTPHLSLGINKSYAQVMRGSKEICAVLSTGNLRK